jgi:hypothetical protein
VPRRRASKIEKKPSEPPKVAASTFFVVKYLPEACGGVHRPPARRVVRAKIAGARHATGTPAACAIRTPPSTTSGRCSPDRAVELTWRNQDLHDVVGRLLTLTAGFERMKEVHGELNRVGGVQRALPYHPHITLACDQPGAVDGFFDTPTTVGRVPPTAGFHVTGRC